MNIIRLQPDITGTVAWPTLSASKKSVVTVGVFDGVHRGHQSVIKETVRIAKREKCFSVVIMFDPRPAFVHVYAAKNGGMEPTSDVQDTQKITGVDERLRMMNALHVDYVLIVRYDLEFAAKSFRFFLGQLVGKLGMRTLVLGEDARMGANLEGTVESIGRLAEGTGVFELVVVPDHGGHVFVPQQAAPHMPEGRGEPADPFEGLNKAEQRALTKRLNSKKVRVLSSTNVRWLLGQGRIMAANDVLGHTHGVEGTVVHGEERGRTIGFPTANVETPIDGYLPVDGVYAGWLIDLGPADEYDESQRAYSEAPEAGAEPISQQYTSGGVENRLAEHSPYRWPAAISIGRKPTFNEQSGHDERVLEAYALTDDWLELYGHRVRCEFVGFLRPQIKFDSADDLVAELKRNADETRELTSRAS
ncbi:bifunctional riboflavin kinase/FMN adenylyltransferase [Bifidobacterium pseudolongum subsp. globosum]|uniref:Bifunctional riboflavin kinase/FMN adenylyltransferase n=1 Tax=Bifidobacterium pseudolongum subsp. globosum TaxID=1690 RepID=A0A8B3RMQ6_9BIFI|nr:riboflavin kinase [Bifidobacterium pseudolongum]RYP96302.1 bifunctional riboflavin kinase/FMN adenylyltransferase [Bifidobacterium pseudolongum subsp. globosum]RYQ02739.1 bifunctional riboflavin kinase/FMN adenylyltransferase [Bifidobacterium pseudolongum subsp. globosum]RYQ02909.1 bifunctional riboflavin kinase/FMN adenylyltransferase [Bifidobacterium pseudolongum subsp. globosum]RYQ45851.1 bifunctional riboflavin kinase/FMN adenylyltransferase [Bifidobacterium pseudolongum subsp. globosum]